MATTKFSLNRSARMKAQWAALSPEARAARLAPMRQALPPEENRRIQKARWAVASVEERRRQTDHLTINPIHPNYGPANGK